MFKWLVARDIFHGSRLNLDNSDRRIRVVLTPLAFRLELHVRRYMPENICKNDKYDYSCSPPDYALCSASHKTCL